MTTVAQEDIQKAIAWIDEHWTGQKACPICQGDSWGVSSMVGEVHLANPDEGRLDRSYPLVILTCQTCGYALLFNAVVVGLLERGL